MNFTGDATPMYSPEKFAWPNAQHAETERRIENRAIFNFGRFEVHSGARLFAHYSTFYK